jgi:hypothetical protein
MLVVIASLWPYLPIPFPHRTSRGEWAPSLFHCHSSYLTRAYTQALTSLPEWTLWEQGLCDPHFYPPPYFQCLIMCCHQSSHCPQGSSRQLSHQSLSDWALQVSGPHSFYLSWGDGSLRWWAYPSVCLTLPHLKCLAQNLLLWEDFWVRLL